MAVTTATAALLQAPASAGQEALAGKSLTSVIPAPAFAQPDARQAFRLGWGTLILTQHGSREAAAVGKQLADVLRPSTGYPLPVLPAFVHGTGIQLLLGGADPRVGQEGYQLKVERGQVVIRANTAAGLFAGTQTLRQLLPAAAESKSRQKGPWVVPGGRIVDFPRFAHRGAMLDVSRHFFSVGEVKSYIDQLSQYKINRLHLHLSDDQGWRIEIPGWPRLTSYGASTEVGGGPGGFYTKRQYLDLVAYARSRFITIIPEIDMPGHTNAALASYAELNCDGVAPPLYTGTEVGFSSFCIDKEITYKFIDDVVRELAALTPGEYIHIGGDEAHATEPADYLKFMRRVLPIAAKYGKKVAGWHEFVKAQPVTSAVPQYWGTDDEDEDVAAAAARGNKVLLSPAHKAYLDMKYDENTPLGQDWAAFVEVDVAYGWNPGSFVKNVPESSVLGVEAPLWSETLEDSDDIEFMAFPRLPAVAELGWSPWSTHDWASFRERLAQQGDRWQVQGVNFYRSPQIPWHN
ncbi:beta-N-acetylhexosaminidase [Kibdelosporangium phytohabitans]|uniref:beta-N-acetylhexosaminidase n=1 Tax=Kibdelosporangium phytohabitans TaxID=860235 RepID=A0A0N9HWI2_9PSEU|nr:beta-N-acetylhexosaminidase [Kibdelosporangium phytohabitans]ALG06488.1 beta-N-acetylhexosaminidase [Kibdelosporangium phytohabitans]